MISVCLAAYNGEKYIQQQIESIISQINQNDELIISDDGSTDATIPIIRELANKHPQIKFLEKPDNIICSEAINNLENSKYHEFKVIYKVALNFIRALKEAKGDTIYLCDQDDVWLPSKIQVCESILKKYDVVVHRRKDVDSNLQPLKEYSQNTPDNRKATFLQSLRVSHFQGACMGFTKKIKNKIFENIDLFYSIPLSQDHAIGYIALVYVGAEHIYFESDRLILYRRHDNNVSPTGEKSSHTLKFKLLYRWNDMKFYSKLQYRKKIRKS